MPVAASSMDESSVNEQRDQDDDGNWNAEKEKQHRTHGVSPLNE
jgi:hypothetical protein